MFLFLLYREDSSRDTTVSVYNYLENTVEETV